MMTIQYFLIVYNTHKDHVLLLKSSQKSFLRIQKGVHQPSYPCTLVVIDLSEEKMPPLNTRVANIVFARYGKETIDKTIQNEPLTRQQTL